MKNNRTGSASVPAPYPEPDLDLNIPADVWVIIGEQQPPPGAYVTPTHIPYVSLAWIPHVGAVRELPDKEETHDPPTDIWRSSTRQKYDYDA